MSHGDGEAVREGGGKFQREMRIFIQSKDSSMENFITGGSNTNTTVRGTYYVCNQHEYPIPLGASCTMRCNANIPAIRFVLVQQKYNAPGTLNVCEILVFEARNSTSKLWNKLANFQLKQPTPYNYNRTSINSCIINCLQLNCDFLNYDNQTTACEIFVYPFGY
ncbi:hypothetical protein HELRODRAFT_182182 [Helobdella robusta]|uniref:Apple domain-containing protein n=1 Tax=Helobdella robusta TaxID=6412 RepID=T1FHW0_HELRO|nr:hypothetical protein HELRODRAFT_182182 [Helobdella robusta]ESN91210.1 hypothetical protein HELRODRAFT_182182 [Helobdella robusta]